MDLYFIDVEGGQATLLVSPERESLLIDAGFAGSGAWNEPPGEATKARDAGRIVATARAAGVSGIDYLLVTHFHGDHVGGVPELAQLMPIRHFIDHGNITDEAEKAAPGMHQSLVRYFEIRKKGVHLKPRPGDRLPLRGVEAIVVSSAGAVLPKPLPGAGGRQRTCESVGLAAMDPNENPRSTGVVVRFGRFRFVDLGDLTGPPLRALACPRDLIGHIDVYLVPHHGEADAADPATFAAFRPRVAILNNGQDKGASRTTLQLLHTVQGVNTVWQLHRAVEAGEQNFADEQIANLDDSGAHAIRVNAGEDGSFRVLNERTGKWLEYPPLLK